MSAGQVLAALAALALVAGVAWRRRRLGLERSAAALIVAALLVVYASGVLPELPDAKEVIGDVATALGSWTYVLVGALAFLETGAFVGLVAPGETVVIAGGVIAGQGEIDLLPLIGLVWACAMLGDSTSFLIGRKLGRGFLLRHGPRIKITRARLEQVESYFRRHGGKTVLIGRFIGLVRALAPFIAGSSKMPYGRFLPFSVVGTGLWGTTFSVLGYLFWQSFDRVAHVAGQATFAFGVVVTTIVAVVYAYRRLRREEERRRLERWVERQSRRSALRPLFAVARPVWRSLLRPVWRFAAPQLRFLWNRLTPGELGLELTTAIAVGGAGAYAFVFYATLLAGDPAPRVLDRETLDLTGDLRTSPGLDVAKVITDLGALPTLAVAIAIAVVVLTVRRKPYELLTLVVGSVLLYLAVQAAKSGIDRPRPSDPLVETSKASFPSGHAAYSTAWVALALALSRMLPGLASTAGLVVAGVALSAVIGLSRVYLRAHYLSDVVGGWGLGFAIFGLCAAAALVVAFVRQNAPGAGARTASGSDR